MRYLLGAFMALFLCPAWAISYYVDCSAPSDGSNTGTFASPFERLTDLVWATIDADPDPSVLLKAGTTCTGSVTIAASGTSTNPVRFGVYNASTGNQITDGSSTATIDGNNANDQLIIVTSRSWVSINGFTLIGSSATAFNNCSLRVATSDDISVSNIVAVESPSAVNACGAIVSQGNRVSISNMTANGFSGAGIYYYSGGTGTFTGHSLTNSTFNNGGHSGVRIQCDLSNTTYPNFTISGVTANTNGATTNGWGIRSTCPMPGFQFSNITATYNFQDGIELITPAGVAADYDYTGGLISGSNLSYNRQFGLHGISARYYTVRGNVTNYNGFDDSVDFGRGIEIVDNAGDRVTGTSAITLSAVSGAGVTADCGACAQFASTDVGKTIVAQNSTDPGAAIITGFTSSNVVTVTVLEPFPDTSVASWIKNRSPIGITVENNECAYNYNYYFNSSEGIGCAFDDYTLNSLMRGNRAFSNEGKGIEVKGLGNVVVGNVAWDNSTNNRASPSADHFEIVNGGNDNLFTGNSMRVVASGASGEKNGTGDGSVLNNGTFINNAIMGAGTAAIERSDTGSFVSHNAINGTWTRNVQDTSSNAEAQTAGQVTADFRLIGGPAPSTADGFRTQDTSPLRRAGTAGGSYHDQGNRLFSTPPTIGAWEAASGDIAANRTTAANRTQRN